MAKKPGFLSLLTGVALGAAAVFFSKPENREKAKEVAKKAKNLKAEYEKDPAAFKAKLKKEGKKLADTAVKTAKKKSKKLVKKTAAKKTAAKKKA